MKSLMSLFTIVIVFLVHQSAYAMVGVDEKTIGLMKGLDVTAHRILNKLDHFWPNASTFTVLTMVGAIPAAYAMIKGISTFCYGLNIQSNNQSEAQRSNGTYQSWYYNPNIIGGSTLLLAGGLYATFLFKKFAVPFRS